ncbi:MAG: DNA internalization-related competence protein ComEC/Rec2 [Acidobacteria bacterium]|nr:DNA internalization-related competence protein ComEC/Rec2 [Acidobacteriota bacterium]
MSLGRQHAEDNAQGHPAPMHFLHSLVFRSAPLFFAALFFALGIAADTALLSHWQTPALRCVVTIAFIAIAYISIARAPRLQLFATAVVWLSLGWMCAGLQQRPTTHAPITTYADALIRDVEGRVTNVRAFPASSDNDADTSPSEAEQDNEVKTQLWSIDLAATRVEEVTPDHSEMMPTAGGVRILMESASAPDVHCGDVVRLPVRMRTPARYRDPGVWQYADWLQENNIAVRASTRVTTLHAQTHSRPDFSCRIHALQSWATNRLQLLAHTSLLRKIPTALRLTTEDASLIAAMLVGDRTGLQHAQRIHFERTGTFHLVVVAGMHVGILAACILWLLTRFGASRITSTLITLLVTSAYALLTGFGAPVQRALFMTAAYLLARMIGRRTFSLNPLGFAALVMLAVKPSALFEASFQMTVLAVIAIGGIALPFGEHTFLPYARAARRITLLRLDPHLHPQLAQFRVFIRLLGKILSPNHASFATRSIAACVRVGLWIAELILMSIISEMMMSLPMMLYFHRLTPAALPANLLVVPLIPPMMIAAAAAFVATCIHPLAGALVSIPAAWLLHMVRTTLLFFSKLRVADLRTPPPATWQVATILICWALVLWLVRRSRWHASIGAATLLFAFGLLLIPTRPQSHANTFEVTAIDVAQGDSILTIAPNGATMLIDAGGPTGRASSMRTDDYDIGEEVVSPYLWQRHIAHIDTLVLTHAHSDHIGGMVAVMGNFHPRELWLSVTPQSNALKELLVLAQQQHVQIRTLHDGDHLTWNGVSIHALAPAQAYTSYTPQNNDSLVLRMTWQHASALLAGDAESLSEKNMLAAHASDLGSTLLKVAHHGSRTSTSESFLNAVHPQAAVISDGRNNTFGHPRMEVLERLQSAHVRTYRTDMLGVTTFLLTPDGSVSASTSYAP